MVITAVRMSLRWFLFVAVDVSRFCAVVVHMHSLSLPCGVCCCHVCRGPRHSQKEQQQQQQQQQFVRFMGAWQWQQQQQQQCKQTAAVVCVGSSAWSCSAPSLQLPSSRANKVGNQGGGG
jgi:hypothetical protein